MFCTSDKAEWQHGVRYREHHVALSIQDGSASGQARQLRSVASSRYQKTLVQGRCGRTQSTQELRH